MSPMPGPLPLPRDPLRIEICRDAEDLARHAAALFVEEAGRALGSRRQFAVALSGGETPRRLYELLTQDHYAYQIVWPAVQVYFVDERCVPPEDPASNHRMAHETLLDHVPVPPSHVHRMAGEDPDPARAADRYARELREVFERHGRLDGGWPRFDLVLLGMGADGHTASLFPGTDAVHEAARPVVAVWVAKLGVHRITLTPPVLNRAATVLFLVTGSDKADTLAAVLDGPTQPDVLPSQIVQPAAGAASWLVDAAAGARLGVHPGR